MKLKIAIQKSGRLYDDSIRMLNEAGINIYNGQNKLKAAAQNFPLEVYFLRDDDIPQYVEDGVADIGIVGENVVLETGKEINVVEKMGFGKCRLSIAFPRSESNTDLCHLQGKRIATSYPVILKKFLKEQQVDADIHVISGSVEIAPGIGLADAICDLVSSGSTLLSNGLVETAVVLRSEAVLVANKLLEKEKLEILGRLLFRIRSVKKAQNNKYILLNAPNDRLAEICTILPGMKSPTIVPLAENDWSSVQSVVNENDFWDIIEQLKAAGAEGILVVPIEKMIL